jgi:hypothetical protein
MQRNVAVGQEQGGDCLDIRITFCLKIYYAPQTPCSSTHYGQMMRTLCTKYGGGRYRVAICSAFVRCVIYALMLYNIFLDKNNTLD